MPTGSTSTTGATAAAGSGGSNTSGSAGGSVASAGSTGGSAGGTGSTTTPAGSGAGACLDGIADYDKAGPFKFMAKTSGSVKEWVPMVPAGCKVPMVHLANGTGATCSSYQPALERLASHGFLTLCYEDPNTGSGDQGIMAFDTALKDFPDLADMKFGSTGHSQGGQAAFTVLQKAEAKWGDKGLFAGLAMEPASGFGTQPAMPWQTLYKMIKSPMFMFSGVGTDGLVSQDWVQQAFDAMSDTVEKYFWARNGATHIPVPNGEEEQISIPWFRWKLLGDQKACMYFKGIPKMDTTWMVVATKNEAPCM
jgi:hypothetical protein